MDLGPPELILIFVIILLLFGVGRIGKLGAEAGQAIREFRRGLANDGQPPAAPPPPDGSNAPDDPRSQA
jgi:sec-independent protein translocase protein TatA